MTHITSGSKYTRYSHNNLENQTCRRHSLHLENNNRGLGQRRATFDCIMRRIQPKIVSLGAIANSSPVVGVIPASESYAADGFPSYRKPRTRHARPVLCDAA